jgi:hypothetical protein
VVVEFLPAFGSSGHMNMGSFVQLWEIVMV